jgi:hypothetical protein
MATENRGVMVYLPSEVEAKMIEYCTRYNITRKDKQGNIVTSLGSGIVTYLKSQLLGNIPRGVSDRPTAGLTRQEVLDLIAESSTGNTPIVGVASLAENRSPDPLGADVVDRLETILLERGFANEQQLSSSTGISRDEVEQLIQVSEQRVLEATRSLWAELRGDLKKVRTIEEQVNTPPIKISTNSQDKSIADTVKSPATNTEAVCGTSDNKPLTKDIRRWLEPLKDKKFSDIIQVSISEKLSNKEIVTRLFTAGYGKNENTEPYPPNLASAMKTAWGQSNSY